MNNLEIRRERYLKDSLQIRLGGLAANLARIASFAKNPVNLQSVKDLIEESKFFIEWTANETETEKTFELIDLQISLLCSNANWKKTGKTKNDEILSDSSQKIGRNEFYNQPV